MADRTEPEVLLELFDETHDVIHMLRHMATLYLEKAEDLEGALARALRLELVNLDMLRDIPPREFSNVIPFPMPLGGSDE